MTTNYHTPIVEGAAANHDVVNAPLGELDNQLYTTTTEVVTARGSKASLDARLDISLNDDGTIGTGKISAQSMINLSSAAATNGDAVRYDEFTLEHLATGQHDVSDFAGAGLEDDGSENLRIAAAAAGAGLTGGGGSALAVQVDGTTIEIPVDTLQVKDGGISLAKMAAGVLSGYGNTAGRPAAGKAGYHYFNTQTGEIQRDNGATYDVVCGMISSANCTDLTDGGETTLHRHGASSVGIEEMLYVDHTASVATDTEAAALPIYIYEGHNGTTEFIFLRLAYCHRSAVDSISIRCHADNNNSGVDATLKLAVVGTALSATITLTHDVEDDYSMKLTVNTLTDLQVYEIDAILYWAGTTTSDVQVTKVTVWANSGASVA